MMFLSCFTLTVNVVLAVDSNVEPFDCLKRSGPLQVVGVKNAYDVRELNISTGSYNTLFSVPKTKTSPSLKYLNGCGINPIDQKAYCNVLIGSDPYLSRFDEHSFEFVARLPAWSFSATFSSDGTFYMHAGKYFYKFPSVDTLSGFASQYDAKLANFKNHDGFRHPDKNADLVAIEGNFDGAGNHTWLVGLHRRVLTLCRMSEPPVHKQFTVPVSAYGNSEGGFGAGYSFANRIYFGANSGRGMYEVSNIDWASGLVTVERVGPSAQTSNNDGMNCMNVLPPWQGDEQLWGGRCPKGIGTYPKPASIVRDTVMQPVPMHGDTSVKPDALLMFLPTFASNISGFRVHLSMVKTGSNISPVWKVACDLPCGVNVCQPPYGLDNSAGGLFAWRVDTLMSDGAIITGPVWEFQLRQTVTYEKISAADTYIDMHAKNYGHRKYLKMNGQGSSPTVGFVGFNLVPPESAGVEYCELRVESAVLQLTVTGSGPMSDLSVHRISPGEENFEELAVTGGSTGQHPGAAFNTAAPMRLVQGPVPPGSSFLVDVTSAVEEALNGSRALIAFGLTTHASWNELCARDGSNPIAEDIAWCVPKLRITSKIGSCARHWRSLGCPTGMPNVSGPLDAMCTPGPHDTSVVIEDWREPEITTTTTTSAHPSGWCPLAGKVLSINTCKLLELAQPGANCLYGDHVPCPAPFGDVRCSAGQCCPDGSTCPSSFDDPAPGCNLKKYDCTSFPPSDKTCKEGEIVACPGFNNVTCAGDMLCPDGTTCPSASVLQLDQEGYEKRVDCDSPFSGGVSCAIGEFVHCPDGVTKCHGDQCCPDGSTCPSAPTPIVPGCTAKNFSCELLKWDVSVRVAGVVFENVSAEARAEIMAKAQATYSWNTRVALSKVSTSVRKGSIIIDAEIEANAGWSQKRLDAAVTERLLSSETRDVIVALVEKTDGIVAATTGSMVVENILGRRIAEPAQASTTIRIAPEITPGFLTRAPAPALAQAQPTSGGTRAPMVSPTQTPTVELDLAGREELSGTSSSRGGAVMALLAAQVCSIIHISF